MSISEFSSNLAERIQRPVGWRSLLWEAETHDYNLWVIHRRSHVKAGTACTYHCALWGFIAVGEFTT
jgi:hypothetical protein